MNSYNFFYLISWLITETRVHYYILLESFSIFKLLSADANIKVLRNIQ